VCVSSNNNKTKPEFPIKKPTSKMSRTRKETKEERVLGIRDLGFLLLRGYNSSLEGHRVYIERQNQEGFCCVC
jgi:hypothetical protein